MRLYPSAFIPGARGRRAVALIALLLASVAFLWIILASPEPDHGRVVLQRATLQSAAGERAVLLPHALARNDFAPEGERVRYQLALHLDDPETDRAIYIAKMSRAGRLWLNGHDLGSCGPLALERLRCLHQPQLFRPHPQHWKSGINQIEIEVFGSHRQTNGLSTLIVGRTDDLHRQLFRPNFMLRVDSIDFLSWLTFSLGLLSLLIFAAQRDSRLYGWFGSTCVFGFLSNFNILVTAPSVSLALFDWFVFSSRIVFTCMLGITYLCYFEKDRAIFVRTLTVYAVSAPIAIWLTGSDPALVSLMYMPLQAVAVMLSAASLWWAWRSGRMAHWLMAGSFLIMPLAGFLDLARLRGGGAFIGTYVLVYTSAVTLALMGLAIIGTLALALQTTRNLAQILQQRIGQREAELDHSYRRLVEKEQQRARAEERERMLQDMHDGFLSTLSATKILLASGQTSTQQASAYVADCVDDLRLMLETSSSESGALADTLADFVYRFRDRIASAGIDVSLDLELDNLPALSSANLLQAMRIFQEATNNAIRHSMAQTLRVSARWEPQPRYLTLVVDDDGRGIAPLPTNGGRGMANIRARALALKGELEIASGDLGTRICVVVPLGEHRPTPEFS